MLTLSRWINGFAIPLALFNVWIDQPLSNAMRLSLSCYLLVAFLFLVIATPEN